MSFDHLFTPLRLGGVEVRNRLFVSAHHTALVSERRDDDFREWSYLDARAAAYVEDRAKGGFGLIIVGQTQVHPRSGRHRPAAYGPDAAAGFADMAARCHAHDTRLFVQLNQNGNEQIWTGPDNWDPGWAPSAMASLDPAAHGETAKAMDDADMDALVAAFADAAANVAAAGVDGVEIHAAHPHLLGQWLVPAFNHRRDGHGGSLVARLRLVLRVIEAVRRRCPRPFVVGVRINGAWTIPGGQTLSEGVEIATTIAATGEVDFLDVSGWPGIGTIGSPSAALIPYAAAVRAAVRSIPVLAIGRITDPSQADDIIAAGHADMVGMTRASIADPELPAKAQRGETDDIRRCVGAGQGCMMRNAGGRPITCTQNPAVGREAIWGLGTLRASHTPRPVVVVGGGVAGLEAAWVAAAQGHAVTLVEASEVLGGQLLLAANVRRRQELREVVNWRVRQIETHRVDVRLGTRVDAASLRSLINAPDAVTIVATGSSPRRRGPFAALPHLEEIPGADLPHVHTVWDVLEGALDECQHVVVVDGCSYYQSSDPVEYLAARGIRVTALAPSAAFAEGLERNDRPAFMAAARQGGVRFHPSSMVAAIEEHQVDIVDTLHGENLTICDVDAVVLSIGNEVVDDVFRELAAGRHQVHRVGDCLAPRGIEHALFEAHRVARSL